MITPRDESRFLCRIRDLAISFPSASEGAGAGSDRPRRAVDGVGFSLGHGAILAIVGESGSGKSLTALSVLGLLPASARVESGTIELDDGRIDLRSLSPRRLRPIRGGRAAMIFQEPMSALNPVFTVGEQVQEAARLHRVVVGSGARRLAIEALAEAGITDPERRARQYPHELSGGLRQRVCIAMALVCNPSLLIADEPTTALDATVQSRILALLASLRRTRGLGIILITHALGVAESFADAIAVMDVGRIVEFGPANRVLAGPLHPYTRALVACSPSLDRPATRLRTIADSISAPAPEDDCTWWPRASRNGPSRLVQRSANHWVAEIGSEPGELPWVTSLNRDMHNSIASASRGQAE